MSMCAQIWACAYECSVFDSDWIFLFVKLNNNYDRASYKQSSVVNFSSYMQSSIGQLRTIESPIGQVVISKPWPDLIAGILVFWVSLLD